MLHFVWTYSHDPFHLLIFFLLQQAAAVAAMAAQLFLRVQPPKFCAPGMTFIGSGADDFWVGVVVIFGALVCAEVVCDIDGDRFRLPRVEVCRWMGLDDGDLAVGVGFEAPISMMLLLRMVLTSSRMSIKCWCSSCLKVFLGVGGSIWCIQWEYSARKGMFLSMRDSFVAMTDAFVLESAATVSARVTMKLTTTLYLGKSGRGSRRTSISLGKSLPFGYTVSTSQSVIGLHEILICLYISQRFASFGTTTSANNFLTLSSLSALPANLSAPVLAPPSLRSSDDCRLRVDDGGVVDLERHDVGDTVFVPFCWPLLRLHSGIAEQVFGDDMSAVGE